MSLRAILALGLLALGACKPTPSGQEMPEPGEQDRSGDAVVPAPIVVGALFPLSGPQSTFGEDARNGARLAVEQSNAAGGIGGRPVHLEVADSAAEDIPQAVERLVGEAGAVAIIGEMTSAGTVEAGEALADRGVPLVSPAATHRSVAAAGPHVFRVCYEDPFQAEAMAAFALSVKANTAVILVEEGNSYSEELAKGFREAFARRGGQIVGESGFEAGDAEFSDQVELIRAKAPDVVFLPSYYREAALVLREAREAEIATPFLGCDGWDSREFLRVAGEDAENCYAASHFSHERAPDSDFVNAYVGRYGGPPPPLAALAYDAVRCVLEALSGAGSKDLLKALAEGGPFEGVTGTIAFDANGTPKKPVVILRVEKGEFTFLEAVEPEAAPSEQVPEQAPEGGA